MIRAAVSSRAVRTVTAKVAVRAGLALREAAVQDRLTLLHAFGLKRFAMGHSGPGVRAP